MINVTCTDNRIPEDDIKSFLSNLGYENLIIKYSENVNREWTDLIFGYKVTLIVKSNNVIIETRVSK